MVNQQFEKDVKQLQTAQFSYKQIQPKREKDNASNYVM